MSHRKITAIAIILFCIASIIFTFAYGRAKRIFVDQKKSVTIYSAQELNTLWHETGVHGRIAVIFARHLTPQSPDSGFPEMDYLDNAMRQGRVRTTYVVVPDRFWPEVVNEQLYSPKLIVPLKTTDTGFLLLHEGGRIHVMPLSKYIPASGKEMALIVIEQNIWSQQESDKIAAYLNLELQPADLIVTIEKNETHPK